ncbi:hypothetical protein [Candidatus Endomicrobiellum agilis]|uniref:hypothetical protein n=1 Tax=Candidatus Endomicrobiellum agilis TaxID=3238957 RepID=UPI00357DAAC2|nr:hypothetical protein [Endomicrobium sp.]
MKKKISLVLLTVLMICSCGKKQDPANSVSPTKYVDSHDITNNNLNTNMLNLTEEQMETVLPYVKLVAYSSVLVGLAAIAYMIPPAYNYIFSPAAKLIMRGLCKIPKVGNNSFIQEQAKKSIFPESPKFPTEITVGNSFEKPLFTVPCNTGGDGSLTKNTAVVPSA